MPLRLRLIALIGMVLLASLAGGSVLVCWHAASSVRTELHAALGVGVNTIRNGFDEIIRSDDQAGELRRLVSTFNGNRHVRAILLDARDQPVVSSELFGPTQPVPKWFRRLIGGEPSAVRLAVPASVVGGSAVVLHADPANESGEVWLQSRDALSVLAGFALMSAVLICLVIGRTLRPLETLATAFDQVGSGDYHGRLPERGPPELARLAGGFNHMTRRLAVIATQNRRLNERLLTLQAEERADLARDLHDEIGPLLFAVDMTAATIERLADGDRPAEIRAHVRAIHDAVGRVQRHVRSILGRLRPIGASGLRPAIDRLEAFWRARRPDIAFAVNVAIEEDRIGDDLKETIYRIVQEGMSNALRHGRPSRVTIAVAHTGDDIRVEVADDGIGMPTDGMNAPGPAQLGLVGMRERVTAMAGSLAIQPGRGGIGLALVAHLPCELPRQMDAAE
jgi:two-component system sensor histidine kinase UhpB